MRKLSTHIRVKLVQIYAKGVAQTLSEMSINELIDQVQLGVKSTTSIADSELIDLLKLEFNWDEIVETELKDEQLRVMHDLGIKLSGHVKEVNQVRGAIRAREQEL